MRTSVASIQPEDGGMQQEGEKQMRPSKIPRQPKKKKKLFRPCRFVSETEV
jgi:hypothetical protein